ncbi:MAG TPA: orotidine-5'-phosphate decarboxylase [Acetobacteraceae bacterium]|jgi:orotidine-5'-phosphate decarboxylase|nr:orotidine-5'-phosphate decarboxylase [Acetobacteraceae bacterium]
MAARDVPTAMADRLIVALDVPTTAAARRLAGQLDGIVSFFKVGLWLLYAPGAERFVDGLIADGKRVFLDAKMYDIGETVRQGVARAVERGVSLVTVHGDPDIMGAAVAGKAGSGRTKVFAISVLTSQNDTSVREMGYALSVPELIRLRVGQAVACGCDGIIASAHDDPNAIRAATGAAHLLIATPGIREPGSEAHDQKRVATPAQAIAQGADYLVVGRPITLADDPAVAAQRIVADMERGRG